MKVLRELLSENSPLSSMRVMAFMSLGAGVGIAAYGLYMNRDLGGLAALCAVFVASAFGSKIGQKVVETKKDD